MTFNPTRQDYDRIFDVVPLVPQKMRDEYWEKYRAGECCTDSVDAIIGRIKKDKANCRAITNALRRSSFRQAWGGGARAALSGRLSIPPSRPGKP